MKKLLFITITVLCCNFVHAQTRTMVVKEELVLIDPPFPECHASTITELKDGSILAAWFGGKHEGHKEVAIWASVSTGKGKWSAPAKVADGKTGDTIQYPCW